MTQGELAVLAKLAEAFSMTRAELDAMRTMVAAVSTINASPVLRRECIARLQAAKDADTARALASPMTDEMLQRRLDWVYRLLPLELRPLIT